MQKQRATKKVAASRRSKQSKRPWIIGSILGSALLIATIWLLSGLGWFSGAVATGISIFVSVFGAAFALIQIIPAKETPAPTAPSLNPVDRVSFSPYSSLAARSVPSNTSALWTIPLPQNPLFTGRDAILSELHGALADPQTASFIQAISGLGGMGKTQTAIEYAYRHRDEYSAVIWLQAETEELLLSDLAALSQKSLLNLPEQHEKEQGLIIDAVIHWLNAHAQWLLILDNVEDLTMLQSTLLQRVPVALHRDNGSLLLTTRAQATGSYIQGSPLEQMTLEQGGDFLLRRAKRQQPTSQDHATAQTICDALGGLPLALDQAGAFIEETGCSLQRYYDLFQKERPATLARRGKTASDHPPSVAKTFTLAFKKIQQADALAATLLKRCAFLYAEQIPEMFLLNGDAEKQPRVSDSVNQLQTFEEALGALQSYSLIRRDPETQSVALHRLIQAVLQDSMSEDEQRQSITQGIHILLKASPTQEYADYTTWSQWEKLLPHALALSTSMQQRGISVPAAAVLLHRTAYYLFDRGRYAEAEPLFQHSLRIFQQTKGDEHPSTAASMHELALLYLALGRFPEAEPLFKHALRIKKAALGDEHPETAASMHELASLYLALGRFPEAEPLFLHSLRIFQQTKGDEHPATAASMHELARLYANQGRFSEAEPLFQHALLISQQTKGDEHPDTAITMHALASLYLAQGRFSEAEPLFQHALLIYRVALGDEHPDTKTAQRSLDTFLQSREQKEVEDQ